MSKQETNSLATSIFQLDNSSIFNQPVANIQAFPNPFLMSKQDALSLEIPLNVELPKVGNDAELRDGMLSSRKIARFFRDAQ